MTLNIKKGEPITLPDGSIVLPEADTTGSKVISAEVLQERQALAEVEQELMDELDDPFENGTSVRRTLADLPVPFKQMNITLLCVAYNVWGLEDHAIARILDTNEYNVRAIIESDVGIRLRNELIESMRHAEAATVHGYLSRKAHAAARTIVASMKSTSADVRMSAAKDILDRTGFRPADRIEHVHKFEDELRIRYVQDDAHIPTINLEVEK